MAQHEHGTFRWDRHEHSRDTAVTHVVFGTLAQVEDLQSLTGVEVSFADMPGEVFTSLTRDGEGSVVTSGGSVVRVVQHVPELGMLYPPLMLQTLTFTLPTRK